MADAHIIDIAEVNGRLVAVGGIGSGGPDTIGAAWVRDVEQPDG